MKKITIRDVAAEANVSLAVVSRVLNESGYVSDEARKSVLNAIRKTGYQPKHGAMRADRQRQRLVALISLNAEISIMYTQLVNRFAYTATRNDMSTVLFCTDRINNATLGKYIDQAVSHDVCGIVIAGYKERRMSEELRIKLVEANKPVIFFERIAGCYGFNKILVDSYTGTVTATNYLIGKGHRHLLYISRKGSPDYELRRKQGFLDAVQAANRTDLIYSVEECRSNDKEAGYQAMKRGFEADPEISAVSCWSDVYAIGAMQYLYEKNIRVRDQVEVIGFDDILSNNVVPPISSIHMPVSEMCESAIGLLNEMGEDPADRPARTIMLEPKLIIRS
ncbi:MAG: LacI family transcriptional regulator [Clostridiales Family XIII bacterium]|nr:LacI family transcriptional regulator [Clostridiales Family XIII bacterium]